MPRGRVHTRVIVGEVASGMTEVEPNLANIRRTVDASDIGHWRKAMTVNHGTLPRGLMAPPRSQLHEGRFGRLFRNLPPFAPDDADLVALAKTVIENPFDVEE